MAKYNLKIKEDVFWKLQQFIPIKNHKGHHKAFRLKNIGENNWIFTEIPARLENALHENIINVLENINRIGY